MAVYKKVVPAQGGDPIYRNETTNKVVAAEDLPSALKEELDLADPGELVDDETITQGEGDGRIDPKTNKPITNDGKAKKKKAKKAAAKKTTTDDDDEESATPAKKNVNSGKRTTRRASNPYNKPVPQSEKGFGFPRKNGKTVDIFDGETPHTHVRLVEGLPVPVSEENYNTKTDSEIYDRLDELDLLPNNVSDEVEDEDDEE